MQPQFRRRGAQLENALLAAAWEELNAVGYANLSMEGIAARAQTSKTVLYRRWPSRAALVMAALRQRTASVETNIPNTGSLRGDMLQLFHGIRQQYQTFSPEAVRGLLAEISDLPQEAFSIIPLSVKMILKQAAARGEIDLRQVTPRVAALPSDLLRHELIFSRKPVSDATLAGIIDEIFLPLVTKSTRAATQS